MNHIVKMEAKDPNLHGDRDYSHRNAGRRRKELEKINQENLVRFLIV